MTVDEFKKFAITESNANVLKSLKLYPTQALCDFELKEKIKQLEDNGKSFTVNYVLGKLSFDSEIIFFTSIRRINSFKELEFNDVYVHPTIKEVII